MNFVYMLWGRDLVSVVRITEGPYYKGFFVGTLEIVPNREVTVRRAST